MVCFLPFCLGHFGLLFPVSLPRGHKDTESCTHSFGCLLIFMQLKAMRNFSIAPPHLPTLPLAAAEKKMQLNIILIYIQSVSYGVHRTFGFECVEGELVSCKLIQLENTLFTPFTRGQKSVLIFHSSLSVQPRCECENPLTPCMENQSKAEAFGMILRASLGASCLTEVELLGEIGSQTGMFVPHSVKQL